MLVLEHRFNWIHYFTSHHSKVQVLSFSFGSLIFISFCSLQYIHDSIINIIIIFIVISLLLLLYWQILRVERDIQFVIMEITKFFIFQIEIF